MKKLNILTYTPSATGTSLQGEIFCSYQDLVNRLGSPNNGNDGYKTDAEWLGTINGKVFTIYNYKTGHNYLGKDGLNIKDIKEWHIGGNDKEVATLVSDYIKYGLR